MSSPRSATRTSQRCPGRWSGGATRSRANTRSRWKRSCPARFGGTRRKTSARAWRRCARRARGCATGWETRVWTRRGSLRTPLCSRAASTLGSVTSTRACLLSARFARTVLSSGGRAPRADETRSRLGRMIPTRATIPTRRRSRTATRTGPKLARRARASATSCARFGVRAPPSSHQPPSCSWMPWRPISRRRRCLRNTARAARRSRARWRKWTPSSPRWTPPWRRARSASPPPRCTAPRARAWSV
mmetsp:Transcript_229/g.928  ORF Transcript_229/g.928 Transcript_229/m.928 type:complete len:246 (-) Transcript_229:1310-2047(-)